MSNKETKLGNPNWVEGVSGNPDGRPAGALSFSTKWFAFMERIAKENGVSTSELDHKMMTVAFKQMQDGKFPYWKDVNDRLYGQATQKHEVDNPTQNLAIEKLAESLKKLSEK